MSLDFLILYEHVVREYESILLLKAELARRGYSVEIRQLLDRKKLKYFTWKKPKVLVSSCMYDDEGINSHVYNNVGVCNKVVNLHWEQMLSDTQEEGAWFNFSGNAKKCVQTCWGKKTQQRLMAHGMQEKNCPVTGAVMMLICPLVFRMLTPDAEVRTLAAQVLRIGLLAEPLYGVSIVAAGALRGAGDTLVPSLMNLASIWGVRLGLALVLTPRFGLRGMWTAMAVELCVRGLLMLLRQRTTKYYEHFVAQTGEAAPICEEA